MEDRRVRSLAIRGSSACLQPWSLLMEVNETCLNVQRHGRNDWTPLAGRQHSTAHQVQAIELYLCCMDAGCLVATEPWMDQSLLAADPSSTGPFFALRTRPEKPRLRPAEARHSQARVAAVEQIAACSSPGCSYVQGPGRGQALARCRQHSTCHSSRCAACLRHICTQALLDSPDPFEAHNSCRLLLAGCQSNARQSSLPGQAVN